MVLGHHRFAVVGPQHPLKRVQRKQDGARARVQVVCPELLLDVVKHLGLVQRAKLVQMVQRLLGRGGVALAAAALLLVVVVARGEEASRLGRAAPAVLPPFALPLRPLLRAQFEVLLALVERLNQ